MNEWFENLDVRERLMVATAAVVVAFALYWLALWVPLSSSERDLNARIDNWQTSLSELRPLRGQLQAGDSQAATAGLNQSLVVVVDNTLRARGLYSALQRSQPTTNDGIRVEFENVAFDELVLWLGELGTQYGLQVQSASFSDTSANDSGRVNASITLERG